MDDDLLEWCEDLCDDKPVSWVETPALILGAIVTIIAMLPLTLLAASCILAWWGWSDGARADYELSALYLLGSLVLIIFIWRFL